jgi:hypothetical protein
MGSLGQVRTGLSGYDMLGQVRPVYSIFGLLSRGKTRLVNVRLFYATFDYFRPG